MKSRVPFDFFPGTPSIMSKIPLNISTAAGLRQNLLTNSESLNMMLSNKRLPQCPSQPFFGMSRIEGALRDIPKHGCKGDYSTSHWEENPPNSAVIFWSLVLGYIELG